MTAARRRSSSALSNGYVPMSSRYCRSSSLSASPGRVAMSETVMARFARTVDTRQAKNPFNAAAIFCRGPTPDGKASTIVIDV